MFKVTFSAKLKTLEITACLSLVFTAVYACVHDNSKNNLSTNLKLEHIVVCRVQHWVLSDQDQGHMAEL